jgi:hypothetical protein
MIALKVITHNVMHLARLRQPGIVPTQGYADGCDGAGERQGFTPPRARRGLRRLQSPDGLLTTVRSADPRAARCHPLRSFLGQVYN